MDIPDGPGDGVRWELTSIRSFCESFIKIQLVLAVLEKILSCGWVVVAGGCGVGLNNYFSIGMRMYTYNTIKQRKSTY